MKIVFLCRLFYPHIGGVERHVFEVSKLLIKEGHSVVVVTEALPAVRGLLLSDKSELAMTEVIEGISMHRISVGGEDWFKKFRVWKAIWSLENVIGDADVVHAHDVFFWYLPFRFLFWNKPIYTTFHGYETVFPVSQRAIFVRKISEKLSRGNIVVGDFIKKWYGTHPDFVIYGGVSKSEISPALNTTHIVAGGKLKIAFIGRLETDTGFIFFRQVVELLKNRNISFDFDIYGDGELKKVAAKVGTVHGFVSTIEKEIAKADIIFASSYLSILESMAQHKLVFSTYSNPLKEDYLKMTPFGKFIIIENDPEKLAEKIDYYINHPKEKKEMTEKAYEWVSKQTWQKVTDTYIRLWKR